MNDQLRALLSEAIRDASLYSGDIPAIDLYLDQIISLVADAQSRGAAHFAERQLTKTMINNYSKDGLIMPVKGKKYTKEQIVQMLLVYSLKNTLSMTEIKRVLVDLYDKQVPLVDCYDDYLATKTEDRELCLSAVDAVVSRTDMGEIDMDKDEDYFRVLMELCRLSDYFRCMAQAMIMARYPDLEAREQQEKDEKQQQKAEAKAQKRAAKEAAAAAEGEDA
jgi:hypothetical protein